jgi:hypothetical protein
MADIETINRLEQLAAWHRINADRAGADWVWEARLRTAEDLERQAAELRHRLFAATTTVRATASHAAADESTRPVGARGSVCVEVRRSDPNGKDGSP